MSDDTQTSWRPSLEFVSKIGVLLIGIVYGLGFMVVAIHLGQYNVSAVSLLRAQYILAGIRLLVPLFISFLAVFWGGAIAYDQLGEKPQGFFRTILFYASTVFGLLFAGYIYAFIGFAILYWFLEPLFLAADAEPSTLTFFKTLGIIVIFSVVISALGVALWHSFRAAYRTAKGRVANLVWGITVAWFCAIASVSYVGFFSLRVYGGIPYALGGGQPLKVRFILKPDASVPRIPALAPEGKSTLSRPLPLLIASEKTYVILDGSDKPTAIEFSKDLVLGITILRTTHTEHSDKPNLEPATSSSPAR
jgi:hypothetical protein